MENNGSGAIIQDSSAYDGLIGATIANNFRLVKRIGSGAMGRVYQAEQLSLGKMVAIKILRHELMADEKLLRRFELEARTASAVSHPNLVETFDCGRDTILDVAYIAMELLQGPDLAQVIAREAPLSLQRTARIMDQVLAALEEAHAQGIIHRDLKPGNIILVPRRDEPDFVKVCDFGIAKVKNVRSTRPSLTMAGFVFGTPEYMSPEQACGAEVDARTDLYAVAAMMYLLVSGELPFPAPSPTEVLARILRDEPERPSARGFVVVPPAIEDLIMRGLEKDPARRPQTASEFRILMRDAWDGIMDYWPGQNNGPPTLSLRAPTPPTPMPRVSAERPTTPANLSPPPPPPPPAPAAPPSAPPPASFLNWGALRGRRPTRSALLGFTLTLGLGAVAFMILNRGGSPDPLAPPTPEAGLATPSTEIPGSRGAGMIVIPTASPSHGGGAPSQRGAPPSREASASVRRDPAPNHASSKVAVRGKSHHEAEVRAAANAAAPANERAIAARGGSGVSIPRIEPAPPELQPAPVVESPSVGPGPAKGAQTVLHKIRATSIPSEAEVSLDGKVVGRTPLFGTEVDIGQAHTLTIRKDGYAPYEQVITASSPWVLRQSDNAAALRVAAVLKKADRPSAGAPASVASSVPAPTGTPSAAVLAATSYKLRITSIPSESAVWIDGKMVGHTPLFGADIEMSRSHRLVIRKDGYAPFEQVVNATSDWSFKPSDRSAALLRISALLRRGDPALAQNPGTTP